MAVACQSMLNASYEDLNKQIMLYVTESVKLPADVVLFVLQVFYNELIFYVVCGSVMYDCRM